MTYIDKAFYDALFPNSTLTTAEFTMFEDIASNIVNRSTLGKINTFELTNFTTTLQDKIKQVTAYQVHIIEENGGLDNLTGSSDVNTNSVTIGKYSETSGNQQQHQGTRVNLVEGIPISPVINIILHGTGLLNTACRYYSLEDINEANP